MNFSNKKKAIRSDRLFVIDFVSSYLFLADCNRVVRICYRVKYVHIVHVEGDCYFIAHFNACAGVYTGNEVVVATNEVEEDLITH